MLKGLSPLLSPDLLQVLDSATRIYCNILLKKGVVRP